MSGWIERILSGLNSEALPDREDAAMWAASLFQIFTGRRPFDPSVDPSDEDLEPSALQKLADILERYVRADPSGPDAWSNVWALGKRFDPALRSLFAVVLAANLQGDPNALHQALVALESLEEPALAGVTSLAAFEVERNRQLAYAVLGLEPERMAMCLGRDCADAESCVRFVAQPQGAARPTFNFDERRGERCEYLWRRDRGALVAGGAVPSRG